TAQISKDAQSRLHCGSPSDCRRLNTPDIGTTNPQIRCKPRRNVALGDNARRCMVCASLVAAPPRCGEASSVFTTEGTENAEKSGRGRMQGPALRSVCEQAECLGGIQSQQLPSGG